MKNQKHLFQLPEDIHYLNAAYMSPSLKSAEALGIEAILQKRNPSTIKQQDFFEGAALLKANFGKIVNCDSKQVAVIPSASYGLMNAVKNLPKYNGSKAMVISNEFPSGYYSLEKWCEDHNKRLETVKAPENLKKRGEQWNAQIIENIDAETAVVLMSSIHWTDGTLFDLKAIGEKCKKHNSIFIVDGTQSVGALPIDVKDFQIDALVCAGYKWLMGPYSIGLAYYSEFFNNGTPLEESWLNRSNAQNFSELTDYVGEYTPGAGRYNVGEYSNFILLPMLNNALEQILDWNVASIQKYCEELTKPLIDFLNDSGLWVEEEKYRAKHLFGFLSPSGISQDNLMKKLQEKNVYVSVRGKAIRVSPHLYNSEKDIQALIQVLKEVSGKSTTTA